MIADIREVSMRWNHKFEAIEMHQNEILFNKRFCENKARQLLLQLNIAAKNVQHRFKFSASSNPENFVFA